jgi:hypothetical protein
MEPEMSYGDWKTTEPFDIYDAPETDERFDDDMDEIFGDWQPENDPAFAAWIDERCEAEDASDYPRCPF